LSAEALNQNKTIVAYFISSEKCHLGFKLDSTALKNRKKLWWCYAVKSLSIRIS